MSARLLHHVLGLDSTDERAELARLRRENQRLRQVGAITVFSLDLITEIPFLGRASSGAREATEAKARRAEP